MEEFLEALKYTGIRARERVAMLEKDGSVFSPQTIEFVLPDGTMFALMADHSRSKGRKPIDLYVIRER